MKLDSPFASVGAVSVRSLSIFLKQKCQFLQGMSRDFGRGGDALRWYGNLVAAPRAAEMTWLLL